VYIFRFSFFSGNLICANGIIIQITLSFLVCVFYVFITCAHFLTDLCSVVIILIQWLFQPIQGPGLLFSSVIIFHRR
jgi:hypothetical protein